MAKISFATQNDLNNICDLEENYFDKYEVYSLNQLTKMIEDKNYIILVAKCDNYFVGYLIASVNVDFAEILKICVEQKHQRKNIATKLFTYFENQLFQNNIKKICLEVRENNIRAIQLYNKLNFVVDGHRKNYYITEDAILMSKNL